MSFSDGKTNGRRSARSLYTLVVLERVADADRRLRGVRAAVWRAVLPIVVQRGVVHRQSSRKKVHERLTVEAVTHAGRNQIRRQPFGAARYPAGQAALALAGAHVLRGKAPGAEAAVPAERPVGLGVFLELARSRLAGLLVLQPRDVGHDALRAEEAELAAQPRRRVLRARCAAGRGRVRDAWRRDVQRSAKEVVVLLLLQRYVEHLAVPLDAVGHRIGVNRARSGTPI